MRHPRWQPLQTALGINEPTTALGKKATDEQTNEQTNGQTDEHHRCVKPSAAGLCAKHDILVPV